MKMMMVFFVPNNCHIQVFSYTSLSTKVLSKDFETRINSQNQTIMTSAYVTWRSRCKRSISGSPKISRKCHATLIAKT